VTRAREILRTGEIGKPSFAQYVYWLNRDGRRPGRNKFPLTMRQPMLYEQTIHHLDTMRFVYGREVERVTCRCHNPPWSMYRDDATVVATLEMTDDLLVNYFGTWSGQTNVNQFLWRTDCSEGALFQHDIFADLRITRGKGGETVTPIPLPPQERLVDDTRLMLTDVARQLLAGERHPVPSGIDHLRTSGLIAACEEAHETRQPVVMAEFFARHGVPPEWITSS
jgi:predicted dehydrogenase